MLLRHLGNSSPKTFLQNFRCPEIPAVHIQMNDGIFFPVVRFVVNRQSFEKLFFSGKNGFQRGYGQGFAETAGPRHKIHRRSGVNEPPDIFGLVHIKKVVFDQLLKCINTARQFPHVLTSPV